MTSPANVRYLTGFTGSNGVLLVQEAASLLGTDARYAVQVAEHAPQRLRQVLRDEAGARSAPRRRMNPHRRRRGLVGRDGLGEQSP